MSVSDPIGDMLTRIRNAVMAGNKTVAIPGSKIKASIAEILKDEGYISDYEIVDGPVANSKVIRIRLKYIGERRDRRPVLTGLKRVSRPGRRVYKGKNELPWVLSGIGISIVSTPKGVMTGKRARKLGVGGEVLCKIW